MLAILTTIAIGCTAASLAADILFVGLRFLFSEMLWLSTFILCLTGLCVTFLAVLYLGFDSSDDALYLALWLLGLGVILSGIQMVRRIGLS